MSSDVSTAAAFDKVCESHVDVMSNSGGLTDDSDVKGDTGVKRSEDAVLGVDTTDHNTHTHMHTDTAMDHRKHIPVSVDTAVDHDHEQLLFDDASMMFSLLAEAFREMDEIMNRVRM